MRPKPTLILKQFSGINERPDPIRIEPLPIHAKTRNRTIPFVEAINVSIDDTGMVSSRIGYSQLLSQNCHSLWSNGEVCLFNSNGNLLSLNKTLDSTTTILIGLDPNARISYVDINGDVFLTNNSIIGYVKDNVFHGLLNPNETFKDTMPTGHLIAKFNASLYVAKDNVLYYSDPMAYQYYDTRHNFYWFKGRITMLAPIMDGIYISDSYKTYFMKGLAATDFELIEVANYPASENTAITINPKDLRGEMSEGVVGDSVLWSSKNGICIGMNGGKVYNLTVDKIDPGSLDHSIGYLHVTNNITQAIFI